MAEDEEPAVKVDSSLLKDLNDNLKRIETLLKELVNIGHKIAASLQTIATKR